MNGIPGKTGCRMDIPPNHAEFEQMRSTTEVLKVSIQQKTVMRPTKKPRTKSAAAGSDISERLDSCSCLARIAQEYGKEETAGGNALP